MSVEQVAAGVDYLEEHVQRIAAEAPPLTEEQRIRLAALLGGVS